MTDMQSSIIIWLPCQTLLSYIDIWMENLHLLSVVFILTDQTSKAANRWMVILTSYSNVYIHLDQCFTCGAVQNEACCLGVLQGCFIWHSKCLTCFWYSVASLISSAWIHLFLLMVCFIFPCSTVMHLDLLIAFGLFSRFDLENLKETTQKKPLMSGIINLWGSHMYLYLSHS